MSLSLFQKLLMAPEGDSTLLVSTDSILMFFSSAILYLEWIETEETSWQKMFDSVDLKGTGVVTFDKGRDFCLVQIVVKTATMDPHPILYHGNT